MTLLISHLTLKKSIITFYFLEDMHVGVIVSLDSSKLLLKGIGDHLCLFLDLNFHLFFIDLFPFCSLKKKSTGIFFYLFCRFLF